MKGARVLMVSGEYPPMAGGVADYTCLLRGALAEIGVASRALSMAGSEAEETVERWDSRVVSTVRDVVARSSIDIIHIQYQAGAFQLHPAINVLPAIMTTVPVVTTFHDLRPPYLFPKAGRLRYALMRRMARWSNAAVVTNPVDGRTLEELGIRSVQIRLGPSLPTPTGEVALTNTIGYFGFPSRQKGFDRLLQAISRFPDESRPSLTIVGGMQQEHGSHGFLSRAEVETLIAESGVTVNRTGYLPAQEASNALAECAVIAFPFSAGASQRSSALIAALQTGRPVVTTAPQQGHDLGSLVDLPQLVTVVSADPNVLRDAIHRGMASTATPSPLPDEYSWNSIASRHHELYASVLGRSPE